MSIALEWLAAVGAALLVMAAGVSLVSEGTERWREEPSLAGRVTAALVVLLGVGLALIPVYVLIRIALFDA